MKIKIYHLNEATRYDEDVLRNYVLDVENYEVVEEDNNIKKLDRNESVMVGNVVDKVNELVDFANKQMEGK